jgi:hypothetical protein
MKRIIRLLLMVAVISAGVYAVGTQGITRRDPLPSWNEGPNKQAIVQFVQATTAPGSTKFVAKEKRIATFDQDGTLWVEHPM